MAENDPEHMAENDPERTSENDPKDTGDNDPERLAEHLEGEADQLERRSRELGERTDDVAQEWERKRSDPAVPGAPQPSGDEDESPTPTGAPTDKDKGE